jgi:hypothetical protein
MKLNLIQPNMMHWKMQTTLMIVMTLIMVITLITNAGLKINIITFCNELDASNTVLRTDDSPDHPIEKALAHIYVSTNETLSWIGSIPIRFNSPTIVIQFHPQKISTISSINHVCTSISIAVHSVLVRFTLYYGIDE